MLRTLTPRCCEDTSHFCGWLQPRCGISASHLRAVTLFLVWDSVLDLQDTSFGESQRDALQPREMSVCPFQNTSLVHQAFLWLKMCETNTRRLCISGVPKLRSLGTAHRRTIMLFREFPLTQRIGITLVVRPVCMRVKQESCFSGCAH